MSMGKEVETMECEVCDRTVSTYDPLTDHEQQVAGVIKLEGDNFEVYVCSVPCAVKFLATLANLNK